MKDFKKGHIWLIAVVLIFLSIFSGKSESNTFDTVTTHEFNFSSNYQSNIWREPLYTVKDGTVEIDLKNDKFEDSELYYTIKITDSKPHDEIFKGFIEESKDDNPKFEIDGDLLRMTVASQDGTRALFLLNLHYNKSLDMTIVTMMIVAYQEKDSDAFEDIIEELEENFVPATTYKERRYAKPAVERNEVKPIPHAEKTVSHVAEESTQLPDSYEEKITAPTKTIKELFRIVNHGNTDIKNKRLSKSLKTKGTIVQDYCVVKEVDKAGFLSMGDGYEIKCETAFKQIVELYSSSEAVVDIRRGQTIQFKGTIISIDAANDWAKMQSLYVDLTDWR